MKTKLLRKWYKQVELDIKKNPFKIKIFSFRYYKDKIRNIGNLPEKRLNAENTILLMECLERMDRYIKKMEYLI